MKIRLVAVIEIVCVSVPLCLSKIFAIYTEQM